MLLLAQRAPYVHPAGPGGLYAESLALLDAADARGQIRDRLGLLEARGRLFLALQRFEDAEAIYRQVAGLEMQGWRRRVIWPGLDGRGCDLAGSVWFEAGGQRRHSMGCLCAALPP